MLVRIVKLQFKEEKINDFLLHFETYSVWDDEKTLENYKNSALFESIWPNIKVWFDAKPEAWSLETTFDRFK